MSVDRRDVIGALAALPLLAGEAVVGKDLMEV